MNPGGGAPPAHQEDEKPMVVKQGKNLEDDSKAKITPPPPVHMFELEGYFRVRADYFKRLDLGLHAHDGAAPPFFSPLWDYASECSSGTSTPSRCRNHTVTSTNMRLRLRPTININEYAAIHSTMDVLDNMVLGSTPEGLSSGGLTPWVAYPGFLADQRPYDTANGWDSIRVKHLWAVADFGPFELWAGRMPDSWGLGMVANDGMGLDDDIGSTVDRIMLKTAIPDYDLKLAVAWDFASQGVTTSYVYPYYHQGEYQPRDTEDQDDSTRWMLEVEYGTLKKTSPLSFGIRASYQRQHYSLKDAFVPQQTTSMLATSLADGLQRRYSTTILPDVWFRYQNGGFTAEAEAALHYGWVRYYEDVTSMIKDGEDMNILQYGGILRMYYDYQRELRFGLEAGFASGDDEYENTDYKGSTHFTALPPLPVNGWDKYNTLFLFHPSYHVDHILFRELLGTVYNAAYVKGQVRYTSGNWTVWGSGLLALAPEPVQTPGNGKWYGYELDTTVMYYVKPKNLRLYLDGGIFFPMEAFDRPSAIYGSLAAQPSFAYTLQTRLVLDF